MWLSRPAQAPQIGRAWGDVRCCPAARRIGCTVEGIPRCALLGQRGKIAISLLQGAGGLLVTDQIIVLVLLVSALCCRGISRIIRHGNPVLQLGLACLAVIV